MTVSSGQSPCRRCLRIVRTNPLSQWTAVSKIGTSIPSTSSSQHSTLPLHTDHAFVVVVIALAVSALVCLCTFILLCRRGASGSSGSGRPREEEEEANVVVPKAGILGDDEEAEGGGGKRRRGGEVELVVMAGEERPTFLAHPAPAELAKAKVVGCPPLQL